MNLVRLGRRRPALLALQGLVLLLALLLLALNAGRLPFFRGAEYRAVFADASGLQVGEEVRVAGIKVGLVRAIELDRDRVVVTFDAKDVRLGRSTTASIEVKTLLGQHYVGLVPRGSGEMAEGSAIPLRRTTTPLNVVPAFQRLSSDLDEIDTRQVARALDSVSGVLETAGPDVRDTLTGLSRLSRTISTRDAQLRSLFDDAESVTRTVAARDRDLEALLGGTTQVLETLDARRRVISRIIVETARLSRQLQGLVADNERRIRPALAKLGRVLQVLRRNRDDLDEAVRLTSLYGREFSNVGGSGRFFDGSITLPRGTAVCTVSPRNRLSGVLDPVLSALNREANGSSEPCLPVGTASDSRGGGR